MYILGLSLGDSKYFTWRQEILLGYQPAIRTYAKITSPMEQQHLQADLYLSAYTPSESNPDSSKPRQSSIFAYTDTMKENRRSPSI